MRGDGTCLGTVIFRCFDSHMLLLIHVSPKSFTQRLLHSLARIHFVLFTSLEETYSIHRTQKSMPLRTKVAPWVYGAAYMHEFGYTCLNACLGMPDFHPEIDQKFLLESEGPNQAQSMA